MCIQFASDIQGKQFSVQSNMMLGGKVYKSMARLIKQRRKTTGRKMMLALEAAQAAGGDIRGKQSAAMLVVPGQVAGETLG